MSCLVFFVFALAFQAKDEQQGITDLLVVIAEQAKKIDKLETRIRVLEGVPTLRVGMCWVVRAFSAFSVVVLSLIHI